jgi:hypothetical protein
MTLRLLKEEGQIRGFVQVDNPGEDFIVTLPDGRRQSLEVKSSYEGMKRHQERYGETAAPVVVVRNWKPKMPEQQKWRIAHAMKNRTLEALLQGSATMP